MATICFLHLQKYSHKLNLFFLTDFRTPSPPQSHGQTDVTKHTVALRRFLKALDNCLFSKRRRIKFSGTRVRKQLDDSLQCERNYVTVGSAVPISPSPLCLENPIRVPVAAHHLYSTPCPSAMLFRTL